MDKEEKVAQRRAIYVYLDQKVNPSFAHLVQ